MHGHPNIIRIQLVRSGRGSTQQQERTQGVGRLRMYSSRLLHGGAILVLPCPSTVMVAHSTVIVAHPLHCAPRD